MAGTYIADLPTIPAIGLDNLMIVEVDGVATYSGTAEQILDLIQANVDYLSASEIGVANGIVPLNGSSLIDTSYLSFSSVNYRGVWNASTNSPTLSNATGAAGDLYYIGTAGTQNLGSGSITFAVGDIVIKNTTVYQKVPIGGISGVVSVNTLSGVVTLTTNEVPDSAGKRYVSDSILAALAGSEGLPSGTNRFVTTQGLTTQIAASISAPIANALAVAAAAQATADAAIPLTQRGSANGVATLDATGKIPASQLSISPTAYVGVWNATTNSPTLTNGTGTAGNAYFCSVAGTVNFGAGAITFAIGDSVIYSAGGVWQKLSSAPAGVTTWNGLSGAVSVTTSSLSDSAGRRYVTDAFLAALTNVIGTPASSTNPLVTEARALAILSGSPTVGKQFFTFQCCEDGTNSSGQQTGVTLAGLGYTSGTAAIRFPKTFGIWGTIPTSATYDWAVMQEAIATLGYERYSTVQSEYNRCYIVNHQIIIPNGKISQNTTYDSYMFSLDFGHQTVFDARSGTGALFLKEPPNQNDANNVWIENKWDIMNLNLNGNKIGANPQSGSYGFKFGCSKNPTFTNIKINGYDIAILGSFLLNSSFTNVQVFNGLTAGIKLQAGWWSGAVASGTVSQPTFTKNRMKDITGAGLYIGCSDGVHVEDHQGEGDGGQYGIFYDNNNETVLKNCKIVGSRFENESKWSNALIGFAAFDMFSFMVDTVFHQATQNGTVLVEGRSTGGAYVPVILRNCRNNGGFTEWMIAAKANGVDDGIVMWDIDNVDLKGQPKDTAELLASTTAWKLGAGYQSYASGGEQFVYFRQRLAKVGNASYLY